MIGHFSFASTLPNPKLTPGVLCSSSDPDFKGYDYPSQIPRCNRNIGNLEKAEVARNYENIPRSEWVKYEFDHYIPLCAGGSNNIRNLWPQPITEARQKDVIEVQVCTALKAGTMTQDQALQKIHDWFNQLSKETNKIIPSTSPADNGAVVTNPLSIKFSCLQRKSATDSKIKITFTRLDTKTITHLLIHLIENNNENEFLNLPDQEILGKLSKTKSGPLNNLLLFSVKNNQDQFVLYLPQDMSKRKDSTEAFFKISFEDSYPNLIDLVCSESN